MGVIARLWVEVGADAKKFEAGIKGIQGKLTSLQNGFNKFGNIMTLGVTVPLIAAGKGMLDAGMQLEATEAKFNTVFKGMTDDATAFIMEFKKLTPLTIAEARGVASGIQDLLVPMGFAREEATELTGGFMHLIGALANFNNSTHTAQEVAMALSSALVGEYESMRRLGVVTSKTAIDQRVLAMGLADTEEEITDQMRAVALLEIVTESSADALAAYTEANLDAKTKMGLMKTEIIDVAAQLGVSLLPIIQKVVEWVRNLTEKFKGLTAEQQINILKWIALAAALGPASKMIAGIIGITKAFIGLQAAMIATRAATQAVTVAAAGGWQALGLYGSTAAATGGKLTALAGAGGPIMLAVAAFAALGYVAYKAGKDMYKTATDIGSIVEEQFTRARKPLMEWIDTFGEIPTALSDAADNALGILNELVTGSETEIKMSGKAFNSALQSMMGEQLAILEQEYNNGIKIIRDMVKEGMISPETAAEMLGNLDKWLVDTQGSYETGYKEVNAIVERLLEEQGYITETQLARIKAYILGFLNDSEQSQREALIRERAMRDEFGRAMVADDEKSKESALALYEAHATKYSAAVADDYSAREKLIAEAFRTGLISQDEWDKQLIALGLDRAAAEQEGLRKHMHEMYKLNQDHFNDLGLVYDKGTGNLIGIVEKSMQFMVELAGKNGGEIIARMAQAITDGEMTIDGALAIISGTQMSNYNEMVTLAGQYGYKTVGEFAAAILRGDVDLAEVLAKIKGMVGTGMDASGEAAASGSYTGSAWGAALLAEITAAVNRARAIIGSLPASGGSPKSPVYNSPKKNFFQWFDTGGIVPGPIGAPQLAVVHGGETILPTHKAGWSGSGSENTIHHTLDLINVPATVDGASLERTLVEMLNAPQVKRKIDRVNYENQIGAVRGLGA